MGKKKRLRIWDLPEVRLKIKIKGEREDYRTVASRKKQRAGE